MGGPGSGNPNPKRSPGRRRTVPGGLVQVYVGLPRDTLEVLKRRGKVSAVLRGLAVWWAEKLEQHDEELLTEITAALERAAEREGR